MKIMSCKVRIYVLEHGKGLDLPAYATPQSAGLDLRAAIARDIVLNPGEWRVIPSGFCMALPEGFEAQIRSRSGLSVNHGITILNSPGTVDSDHRGEIRGIVINLGREPFTITRGMRFAQMVIAPFAHATWEQVDHFNTQETKRGTGGFGSTGK